jgi:hypothetical protein
MVDDEILTRTYQVTPESLWNAVKEALSTCSDVTLKRVEEEPRRALFTTTMSWTSWGENMVATVEPGQTTGSLLKITGHAHTSFLTTKWGEELHQHQLTRNLIQAIEDALGKAP